MKQNGTLNWIIGGIILVVLLFFVKYEMASMRRTLPGEIKDAVIQGAGAAVQDAITTVGQVLSNNVSTNISFPANAHDAVGAVMDTASRAGQIFTNGLSTQPGQPPSAGDLLNGVLNLTTEAGKQVNQLALQATELTVDQEIELGRKMDKEVLSEMPDADDAVNTQRLQTLAKPLLEQCRRKDIPYHIRLVKSRVVNAFSIAGGYIYVTTSFLDHFTSDAELAMTMGHEIAHVDLKHAVHKVQFYYHGQQLVGDLADIGQLCYSVISAPYSRDQEYEADAWGFAACRKAGWESDKLLQTFEDLDKYEQSEQVKVGNPPPTGLERKVGEYFDTHPKTPDRLARLKQLAN